MSDGCLVFNSFDTIPKDRSSCMRLRPALLRYQAATTETQAQNSSNSSKYLVHAAYLKGAQVRGAKGKKKIFTCSAVLKCTNPSARSSSESGSSRGSGLGREPGTIL